MESIAFFFFCRCPQFLLKQIFTYSSNFLEHTAVFRALWSRIHLFLSFQHILIQICLFTVVFKENVGSSTVSDDFWSKICLSLVFENILSFATVSSAVETIFFFSQCLLRQILASRLSSALFEVNFSFSFSSQRFLNQFYFFLAFLKEN